MLPGSPLHRAEWEAVLDRLASLAERPKFVVASGSVPPGAPDDFFARVARHAKALGAKSVIDTSGMALAAALEEGVSVIKPNLVELTEFVAAPLDTRRGPHRRLSQADSRRAGRNRRADARRARRIAGDGGARVAGAAVGRSKR